MPQYIARGTITLRGVDFFIEATDLKDAQVKARQGAYDIYEIGCAEASDWTIYPKTVELSE